MAIPSGILRRRDTASYLGVSLRHLYTIEETDPQFPRKIVFSKRCVGYSKTSLDRYIAQKEAEA